MTEVKSPLSNREKISQLAMLDRGIASQVKRVKTDQSPIFPPQSETRKRGKSPQRLDNKEFVNKLRVLLQGSSHPSIKNSMHEVSSRFRDFEAAKYASDEELNRLPPDLQDLILTLADRIRSIRLSEQTSERSAPPLPTAEDISETWVNRSTESREVGETPLDFFMRVYAPWVGVITKADVRRIDPKLYRAFYNFRTVPSDDVLPNSVGRWDGQVITERDKEIYSKVIALQARKRRATQ